MISLKRCTTTLCVLAGVASVIASAAAQAHRPVRRPVLHQPISPSQLRSNPVTLPPTPGFYTPLVGGIWSPIGPAPLNEFNEFGVQSGMSGRIVTIAASPTNSNIYYVGPAGGGVWKSFNGGTSWGPSTDTEPALTMGAIAVAPSDANVVYAGTGESNNALDSFYGDGILVSTDAGSTWALETGPSNAFVGLTTSAIVVDPTNSNTVYAAMANFASNGKYPGVVGVYKSTDGGLTWANTTSSITTSVPYSDLVMDPANPSILYCAVGQYYGSTANGVYETTNGGTSWSLLANHPHGSTNSSVGRISIAIAASAPSTLYTTIQNAGSPFGAVLGVYKTTDGGATWNQLTNAPDTANPQAWYDMPIAVSPTNANVVVLAGAGDFSGENVAESTDGGVTWNNVQNDAANNGPHTDEHCLVFDSAGRMLNGCDGGIWRLDNLTPGSLQWESINSDLATIQFTGGDLHPTNSLYAVAGSQDNGTEIYNNNVTWPEVIGGDGGFCKIDYTTPLTMYHTFSGDTLGRSDDGGSTWSAITPSNRENSDFYPHFTMDLLNSQTILFPTTGVWRTTNKGANWTEVGSLGSNGFGFAIVDCIGAAGPTIYSSGGGAVFVTTNTGGTWTQVNVPGFTDHFEDIAVNPTNPAQAYIVRDLFTGAAGTGHVFYTSNTGATWTDVTGNMPDLPTNAVKVDWSSSTVWVGTDAGVYTSTVPGQWSLFGSGLPNARVVDLALNTGYGELVAFTHGRSAWSIPLIAPAPVLSSISPTSAIAGSTGLTLTVNGTGFLSGTVVSWGAASLVTTFVSSTQVTAAVPTADLASAGTVVVTAANPSSGPSNGVTFTINNPVPTLTSISPAVGAAGSGPTSITLTGTNFVTTSVAQWAGSPLSTTFGSATSISASVPSSDLTTTGSFAVTVANPTPGGGTSGSQSFVVDTPIILSSLSPPSATAGNYQLSIQVSGTGFTPDCTVYWQGSALSTTFVSSVQLTALVPAADMNTPGAAAVTVQNSLGLVSNNSLTFTVGQPYPVHLVSLRITPSSIVGGTAATGVIVLSGIAPSGGYAVRITSSRPGLTFTPHYVYVHTGVSTASFTIGTAVPPSSQVARITATLGPIARAAYLTVTP